MATAQQIIDRAGSTLKIIDAPGAAVDATTSAAMLTTLQDMIAEWAEKGVIEIPAPSALSDELDVSPGTVRALRYNLAAEYGADIGSPIDPRVIQMAKDTYGWLISQSTVSRELRLQDDGMMVSTGRYNITTDA